MKYCLLTLAGALFCAGAAVAAPICPTTSNNATGADPTGCGVLLTYTAGGPTVAITGTGAYDGSEDTTVGVINHTSASLSSITLHSTMFAFGFDGDGIETFTSTNGVPIGKGGATGYEGPNTTFDQAGVVGGDGTLIVKFTTPIKVGGSDYFSLEGPPSAGIVSGSTPEPASIALLGSGMLVLGGLAFRRRRKQ
jgi:PEP-CTERM motif